MNHADLLTAIYKYVNTISSIPTILKPNIDYDEQIDSHIEIMVLPATPDDIGVNSIRLFHGIIQMNIYVKNGVGEIEAARYSQTLIDAFPRGTILTESTTTIRIDKTASAYQGLKLDNGWYMMPVRVEYNHLC